jgi:diaminohydroxyphosphoribosylaminopyrimidine deaminase/5-amino-6-(5-phosphoribosylamino)uracil reductase
VRRGRRPRIAPLRVIFDRQARLPLDSALARSAGEVPTLVVTSGAPRERLERLHEARIQTLHAATLDDALLALRAQGVRSLLVEGGARLAGTFLSRSQVDRLIIFQAPVMLGAGALDAFAYAPPVPIADARRFPVLERRRLGDDLMSVYALRELPCSPD